MAQVFDNAMIYKENFKKAGAQKYKYTCAVFDFRVTFLYFGLEPEHISVVLCV